MPLAQITAGHIVFDKTAIMRRAYQTGRHALQLARARREPASEINRTLSNALRKAWAEAKAEAADLTRRVIRDAEARAFLAERAKSNAAVVAQYGGVEGLRCAIESESYRDHLNFVAVNRLQAALSSIGA